MSNPEPTEHQQYWAPTNGDYHGLAQVELRAHYAWKLIHHFGVISARPDGQDDGSRQKIALMEPEQVVERAFAITDAFIAECERRQIIRPHTIEDVKAAGLLSAEIEREKAEAAYRYPVTERPRRTRMQHLEIPETEE